MGKRTVRSKITYNKMAADYDSSPEGAYTRPHKEALLQRVAIREGDAILDVACGNGTLLGELSKKASVQAFGLDLSENMIAIARKRYPGCTFQVGPSVPLPYGDQSMDCITLSCAFHHFEDPGAFAAECNRVLKRGGTVYLAEPYFPTVIRWLANALVFPFAKSGDVKVYSPKELAAFFQRAGFQETETQVMGSVLFFSGKKL